jgi:hypothetical protein
MMTNDYRNMHRDDLKDLFSELTLKQIELKLQIEDAEYKKSLGEPVDADWFHRLKQARNFTARDLMVIGAEIRMRKKEAERAREKVLVRLAKSILPEEMYNELIERFDDECGMQQLEMK